MHDPSVPEAAPRLRRSLSAPNLALRHSADPEAAQLLLRALGVPPLPTELLPEDQALIEGALATHLFHSFAARTHPLLVRHLLADVQPEQTVLDPFSGSGTVLIEGMLRGARAVGCDISELAVRLARLKATPMPPAMQAALVDKARAVAAASIERVKTRRRPSKNWDEPEHYLPHIYLELCGLREEIGAVVSSDPPLGEALLLVLSAILIKLSRQRAESRPESVERSLGKGLPTRLFQRKAEELSRLHAALWQRLPSPRPPRPLVAQGDARSCLAPGAEGALPLWPGSVDRVVTSPPYLGTYDYASHHARRYAWLDIDPKPIERGEMAARRHGEKLTLQALRGQHQRDTQDWVSAVARLLKPTARLYVLVGDSLVSGEHIDGARPIVQAAERCGLRLLARAAAERPHFFRPRAATGADPRSLPPRCEHLLLLVPAA
jgi:DNA modification methylase